MKKMILPHNLTSSVKRQIPSMPGIGDEVFTTGVFYFNITALLKWSEQIKHEAT